MSHVTSACEPISASLAPQRKVLTTFTPILSHSFVCAVSLNTSAHVIGLVQGLGMETFLLGLGVFILSSLFIDSFLCPHPGYYLLNLLCFEAFSLWILSQEISPSVTKFSLKLNEHAEPTTRAN